MGLAASACGLTTTLETSTLNPPARPVGRYPHRVRPLSPEPSGPGLAWLTDVEDDSYDLSWSTNSPMRRPAIAMLHELLASDPDPIDRHFQFAELETRLYRSRDLYDSALVEFDDACRRHDAEMETIRHAFMAKWGKVPLLKPTGRWQSVSRNRRTATPLSGGPNEDSHSTATTPPAKMPSRIY
jgi:hypothetical protein